MYVTCFLVSDISLPSVDNLVQYFSFKFLQIPDITVHGLLEDI